MNSMSSSNGAFGIKKKSLMSNSYSFAGVKEMIIDFVCREDLVITTLKEFFEVFISSIKKEQIFHRELLNPNYNYMGVSVQFNTNSSVGTMRILLAENLGKQP